MINTTDEILILEQDENKLIAELRASLLEARNLLIRENKIRNVPEVLNKENKNLSFIYHFTEEKINNLHLDKNFLEKLLEYTEKKDGHNICVEYGFCPSNILLNNFYYKVGLKLTLLSLYKKGLILLPLRFTLGNGISEKIESKFDNPILKHFRNFFQNKNIEKYSKDFKQNFIPKITRLIRSININYLENIKIEDINNLHIHIMDSQSGRKISQVPNGSFYVEFLMLELKDVNHKVNFDSIEYKEWLSGYYTRHEKLNYLEYQSKKQELKEYRRIYNIEDTKNRIKLNKNEKHKKIEEKISRTQKIELIEKLKLNQKSLEEEFSIVSGKPKIWSKTTPIYDGYEFLDFTKESKLWISVFDSYLNERVKNGYETNQTQKTTFNMLMDYIFFYLNAWNIENPDKKISLPLTPKDFKRTLFLKSPDELKNRPYTLLELFELKNRSANYKNRFLSNIKMLFSYIADYYEEDNNIWSISQKNPVKDSDFFMQGRNKKTNKKIIPKKIYSLFKNYLNALEVFGEFLIKKYSNENLNSVKDVTFKLELNCQEFGFIPFVKINNKIHPIQKVPNIYQWRIRTFNQNKLNEKNGEIIETKWLPSNTLLRTYILALNTGLRSAQVLWLDIKNWDSLNEKDKQQTYYKLNVNTDKFKNEDWTTFISHQIRSSLLKEVAFQESMKEDFMNKECNYKGRENTRFPSIMPLFRIGSKDGYPIRYEKFAEHWVEILWGFQNFINEVLNEKYELITIKKPLNVKIEGNENKFCPLNIKAAHTPHSMRATFCTHMAEYLERSEIAELVGHASDLVTSEVYIKPEEEVLKQKIAGAINVLDNGVNASYFEKNSSVHIKPNLSTSSLQKAFSQSREQTIELFNITSISLNINQESEEQSQKAIKLLKDARMDQIVFDPTHICPVGGMCPQEVMSIIAEKRRCGLCPLALKCVDNLNPIYAKQRDLMREIKNGKEKLDIAIKEKESEITLTQIEEKVNLDIRELVSWKFSAEVLSNYYEQMKSDKDLEKKFYVEKPEMVKNHLIKVSVSNEKEYILTRLADANSYSQFNHPENKYRAELLRKEIIKNLNLIEYDDLYVSEEQRIEVFCAMIKNMLESNSISLNQLVKYDAFKSIEQQKSKQAQLFNNKQILLLK